MFEGEFLELRDYQEDLVNRIRASYAAGKRAPCVVLPTGGGKCLGKGTPVLMFNGTIRPVEDVQVGDLLMGPDSRPRRVLSLARGREPLYRVTPTKGDAYVVNESHILSLKRTPQSSKPRYPSQAGGAIVNISVTDYLGSSENFKHIHKGWRAAVDFPEHAGASLLESYFLGLWLGDGTSTLPEITTGDVEIINYVDGFAARIGMTTVTRHNSHNSIVIKIVGHAHAGRRGTPIMNELRCLDLIRNKHIPQRFKNASRQERLDLLAGIIDTDGHYSGKGYDVCLGNERLIDDIIFVARSLGFSAYKTAARKTCHNNGVTGDYWRCNISGDLDCIPCRLPRKKAAARKQKKSVLVTGIDIKPIGDGDYYGFEIDGDRLFMLGDFTVTHNTFVFSYIAKRAVERGNRTLILVHRQELLRQSSKSLAALGAHHGLIARGYHGEDQPLVVASIQTVDRRLKVKPLNFDFIVSDECHHNGAATWNRVLGHFPRARILGVTATPVRLDGKGLGRDHGGIFDDLIVGPSIQDLIKRGALVQPEVFAPPTDGLDLSDVKRRSNGDYDPVALAERINRPSITGSAVDHYHRLAPKEPAIVFCASIVHAETVAEEFRAAGYRFEVIHGKLDDNERERMISGLASGEIHGLVSVDLISEGTDIPVTSVAILLRPTQSVGLFLQQVGRALRPAPGKSRALILDHVGNCLKHGFPDDDRGWSLDGVARVSRSESGITIKQCKGCYRIFEKPGACPFCGFRVIKEVKLIEQTEGELKRISREEARRAREERELFTRTKMDRYKAARSWDELLKVGADYGDSIFYLKKRWGRKFGHGITGG